LKDKEGKTLNNAHILGFFRRICKFLFHNIKPVFVFDGGVPDLKANTIVCYYDYVLNIIKIKIKINSIINIQSF